MSGFAGGAGAEETVPVCHELGFYHGAGFVVRGTARAEDGVDFVDEDDRGFEFAREGEDGGDELVGVAVPFLGEGGDVKVDEAGARFFGKGAREHGFAAAGGAVEKHAFRGGEERGGIGEESGEGERVDDGFAEFVDDGLETPDGVEGDGDVFRCNYLAEDCLLVRVEVKFARLAFAAGRRPVGGLFRLKAPENGIRLLFRLVVLFPVGVAVGYKPSDEVVG